MHTNTSDSIQVVGIIIYYHLASMTFKTCNNDLCITHNSHLNK